MKRVLFVALFFVFLFASVSAFTLRTLAGTREIPLDAVCRETVDDCKEGETIGRAGEGLYSLRPRYDAIIGKAILKDNPSLTVTGNLGFGSGDYTFTLEGLKPITYYNGKSKLKEQCAARCSHGPEALIVVEHRGENVCFPDYKAEYGVGEDFGIGGVWEMKCYEHSAVPKMLVKITDIKAPEYKQTKLDLAGKNQIWYLLLGSSGVKSGLNESTSREIKVDFCISVKINGNWSPCAKTEKELKAVLEGREKIKTSRKPGEIVEEIGDKTKEQERKTREKVRETKKPKLSEKELEKCTTELNQEEKKLIAKARFEYTRAIGYPNGSWNEFKKSEVDTSKKAKFGDYSLELEEYYPLLVNLNGFNLIDPKFKLKGKHKGNTIDCYAGMAKAGYRKLNEVQNCDYHGVDGFLQFRVYKFEAPYFEGKTENNSVLKMGPHCFDVWAYLAVRFKKKDSKGNFTRYYTWWMTTREEVENYLNQKPNFKVIAVDSEDKRVENARVSLELGGSDFSETKTTNKNGVAEFTVSEEKELKVWVEKETYLPEFKRVVASETPELKVELKRASYDLKLLFSKDDFWWTYFNVLPYYRTPPQEPTVFSLPASEEERRKKLSKPAYNISKSQAREFYSKAPEFIWLQKEPCDNTKSKKITPKAVDRDFSYTDYLGFELNPGKFLLFKELKYGGTYYSCAKIPKGIIQLTWKINRDGTVTKSNRRIMEKD